MPPSIVADAQGGYTVLFDPYEGPGVNVFRESLARYAGPEPVDVALSVTGGGAGPALSHQYVVTNNHAVVTPTGKPAVDLAVGAATGVALSVNLSGASYTGFSGAGWSCASGGVDTVRCEYANPIVASGSSSTLILNTQIAACGGGYELDASVHTNQYDPVLGNDSVVSQATTTSGGMFVLADTSVAENASPATISVVRNCPSASAASLRFTTVAGTAKAISDFTRKSGVLSWSAGEGGAKTFTVTIRDDASFEGDESFTVNYSAASGATLGIPATSRVVIHDNELPKVSFQAARANVTEGSTLNLTVKIPKPASQTVTVPISRTGGTASAAQYSFTATSISIPAGATSASAPLQTFRDGVVARRKTVVFTLGTPTNALLGTPKTETVTIVDTGS